jgi:hypothetical protein
MSGMRWWSEMDPRTVAITAGCCGPKNGHEWGEGRQWVCSYHDGYNDGLEACRETEPS